MQKLTYLFRIVGLFAISLILICSATLAFGLSGSDTSTAIDKRCANTKITQVSANTPDPNFPASAVLDSNPQTLWSIYGKGASIEIDLGQTMTVCNVEIRWYKGDQRQNNFIISTSKDGSSFENTLESISSGTTSSFERYDLKDIKARYVKITVNGNTQNNYATIADIMVNTPQNPNNVAFSQGITTSISQNCPEAKISKVTSSGTHKKYVPANAVDNNDQTRWVNTKKNSWITLDLGKTQTICSVDVQWFKGDQRVYSFTISVSKDNNKFTDVAKLKSTGNTNESESYSLNDFGARYVRITVTGNTENNYASIQEINIGTRKSSSPPPPPNPSGCEANLAVSSITSSGNQVTHPASDAIDNNANTRWSNQGLGSWLKLDLGSQKTVCNVAIAWYNGNQRQNTFEIAGSNDGNSFTKIFSSTSSGSTTAAEGYDVTDTQAKYLKITVTGNTQNDWISVTEIDVFGAGSSVQQEICGDGIDNNGNGQVDEGCNPTPPPAPGGDGVKEIYPTKPGGESWFFNPTNPEDGQFDPNGAQISKNSDGSWHLKPGTTRMLAFPKSSGMLSDQARSNLQTYDYSELAQIGYWYKPTDWKNTEMTGYFKVTSSSQGDGISFVTRSARHSNGVHEGCGGSSYHNNIRFDGTFQFKKEMWHVNYDSLSPTKSGIGSVFNKWVGFKAVVYNLPDGNVKLESYVDKDATNNWQKVQELVDSGNWGNDMTHCNAKKPGAQITWGSPMPIFKSTGVTYDFKKFSIREIVPPSK
jgi:hypothetical protein